MILWSGIVFSLRASIGIGAGPAGQHNFGSVSDWHPLEVRRERAAQDGLRASTSMKASSRSHVIHHFNAPVGSVHFFMILGCCRAWRAPWR